MILHLSIVAVYSIILIYALLTDFPFSLFYYILHHIVLIFLLFTYSYLNIKKLYFQKHIPLYLMILNYFILSLLGLNFIIHRSSNLFFKFYFLKSITNVFILFYSLLIYLYFCF